MFATSEPCNLHDLLNRYHMFPVKRCVLYRSCTPHNGVYDLDYLSVDDMSVDDLSVDDLSVRRVTKSKYRGYRKIRMYRHIDVSKCRKHESIASCHPSAVAKEGTRFDSTPPATK